MSTMSVALLSQPNAGKSTLFNGLTGSRQHVGNWPGKTVEKKEGTFTYKDKIYNVMDLPGSYSLSASSDEEIITIDYITGNDSDLVCILADASQLERSLYMLSDFCGINKPALLVLNMMDVANNKGIQVDEKELSQSLGIPVVSMSATNLKHYKGFYEAVESAMENPKALKSDKLDKILTEELGEEYSQLVELVDQLNISSYHANWIATKLIENDRVALDIVKEKAADKGLEIMSMVRKLGDKKLKVGSSKFKWIDSIVKSAVTREETAGDYVLSKLDRVATSRIWGRPFAILVILGGLLLSFVPAMPFMAIGMGLPASVGPVLLDFFNNIGAPMWLNSLISEAVLSGVGYTFAMIGFVLGVSFVFGLLEEVGLMARVSYVFDESMSKLGLQGKSVMPIMVSFGCNMAGTSGSRVIDTWGQKTLTIAIVFAIPCGAVWGIVGLFTGAIFSSSTVFVMLALLLTITFHIWLTGKLFKRGLVTDESHAGMIMELPPYHKPKWLNLIKFTFNRMKTVFFKALKVVIFVCVIIWAVTYTASGNIENTALYRFGNFIEPVTLFFGLKWELFVAWIFSGFGKEATLGVISALFGVTNNGLFLTQATGVTAGATLITALTSTVTKPEALAFLFAYMFMIPCFMTVVSAQQEIHSWKWTSRIVGYYLASSLVYAFIAFRIGLLIW